MTDAARREDFLKRHLPEQPALWQSSIRTLAYKPERRWVGALEVDGTPLPLEHLAVLDRRGEATLRARSGARVMLLGGEAFTAKRYVWWNFVSSRPERIEQAKADWLAGRFPLVPGDAEEFIPLPDRPKTVSE